jgi:glycerol uptake facilitator protein
MFADTIAAYESAHGIVRGADSSVITASMYGEYFPNPTVELHAGAAGHANLSVFAAAFMEIVATALLALCVFALTDGENSVAPGSNLAPALIGLAVAALIVVIGAETQACLNPARDFGPRIVAYFAGWGEVAFPGPRGGGATLLVYLASPLAGGLLGGALYTKVLGPAHGGEA